MSDFNANSLTKNQMFLIGGLLMLILIATRSHFFHHIQDASWAVFFVLGFYLRAVIALPIFLLTALIVDLIVIESKGGESFCFTVSYPFLAPAYGSLWLAGRWLSNHYSENLRGLLHFVGAAVVGITVCNIISSGGFYWFSGRFENPNVAEFASRVAKFLPMFMKTTVMYLAMAAVVHWAFIQAGKFNQEARAS